MVDSLLVLLMQGLLVWEVAPAPASCRVAFMLLVTPWLWKDFGTAYEKDRSCVGWKGKIENRFDDSP